MMKLIISFLITIMGFVVSPVTFAENHDDFDVDTNNSVSRDQDENKAASNDEKKATHAVKKSPRAAGAGKKSRRAAHARKARHAKYRHNR